MLVKLSSRCILRVKVTKMSGQRKWQAEAFVTNRQGGQVEHKTKDAKWGRGDRR